MCGQHNVRGPAGDSTGENTDKGHTPNPGIGIKIPDPAGNRTRAAGLQGRDSTDHATATDFEKSIVQINILGSMLLNKAIYKISSYSTQLHGLTRNSAQKSGEKTSGSSN